MVGPCPSFRLLEAGGGGGLQKHENVKSVIVSMDGWMDGLVDGWMDGWINEWMNGWRDGGCVYG